MSCPVPGRRNRRSPNAGRSDKVPPAGAGSPSASAYPAEWAWIPARPGARAPLGQTPMQSQESLISGNTSSTASAYWPGQTAGPGFPVTAGGPRLAPLPRPPNYSGPVLGRGSGGGRLSAGDGSAHPGAAAPPGAFAPG